jgi:fumarylacetoacetase
MFRPDMPPLLPNYRHIPVGYNGRASSVVLSGTPIRRPKGQTKGPNDENPTFGPTKELDFELEMGFFVGRPSAMGEPVPISEAADHVLGYVLVNDWSARDLQRWEYVPLGPFLAKSFATSISPWVILPDAMEPFRINVLEQDPAPLDYLKTKKPLRYDIKLEVHLQSKKMDQAVIISSSNAKYLYWSFDQQLAHQASNGTPLSWGDLYASGTISGPLEGSFGSLLELTWKGSKPIELGPEERTFLEDGDTLTMSGYCQGDGFRVGFGSVAGTILPA